MVIILPIGAVFLTVGTVFTEERRNMFGSLTRTGGNGL